MYDGWDSAQSTGRQWFAAQVWAGREHLCARRLSVRGYEVFLPSHRVRRKWSDRMKAVDRALFAGYVFCRLSGDAVGKLITTPGVIRIVGDGSRPLPVPREEIESLQRVIDMALAVEPWEFLQVGQRVRIVEGPLRDTEGIVLRTSNRHRLILSVSMLQRSIAVEVEPAWVHVEPGVRHGRGQAVGAIVDLAS